MDWWLGDLNPWFLWVNGKPLLNHHQSKQPTRGTRQKASRSFGGSVQKTCFKGNQKNNRKRQKQHTADVGFILRYEPCVKTSRHVGECPVRNDAGGPPGRELREGLLWNERCSHTGAGVGVCDLLSGYAFMGLYGVGLNGNRKENHQFRGWFKGKPVTRKENASFWGAMPGKNGFVCLRRWCSFWCPFKATTKGHQLYRRHLLLVALKGNPNTANCFIGFKGTPKQSNAMFSGFKGTPTQNHRFLVASKGHPNKASHFFGRSEISSSF